MELNSQRLLATLGLCTLAACAGPPPGEKLSASQLGKEMPSHTAMGTNSRGAEFTVFNAPDGTFKLKMQDVSDIGAYRITADGQLCLKYNKAFDGKEHCYTIYKDGETFRSVEEGSVVGTYTMSPGNPRNL